MGCLLWVQNLTYLFPHIFVIAGHCVKLWCTRLYSSTFYIQGNTLKIINGKTTAIPFQGEMSNDTWVLKYDLNSVFFATYTCSNIRFPCHLSTFCVMYGRPTLWHSNASNQVQFTPFSFRDKTLWVHLNIEMSSNQFRDSHYKDKTNSWLSYLCNGNAHAL